MRASAGADSFRSHMGLRRCLKAAKEQVRQAKAMLDKDDPTRIDRTRAASERAARERVERVEKAMAELKKLQATKPVRGIEKTVMVGLWMAITYNALLWIGANAATL